jgi:hypothetical protein
LRNGGNSPLVELPIRARADFGKMRFGDTYIDPLDGPGAGDLVPRRKVVTGEKKTGKGKITFRCATPAGWTDLLLRRQPARARRQGAGTRATTPRTRSPRVSPAPSWPRFPGAVVNLMVGEDVVGNPVTPGSAIAGLVTPLSLQNVKEIMTEHGVAEGTAIEMLNLLGMGVQYRKPRERNADAAAKREKARAADPRGIGDLSLQERIDAWKTMGADERRDTNMIKHIRDAARTHRKDMTDQQREDVRAILDSQ